VGAIKGRKGWEQVRVVRVSRFGGPEVLSVEKASGGLPGEGEALVRVEFAGVNFIDVYHREGLYPSDLPLSLGLEGAGVVQETGLGVTGFSPGDRVAWTGLRGSYADEVVAPADRLVPLPAEVSLEQGAAAMLQGMTAHYLSHESYALTASDTCLVHAAAGGVGMLLCQMAKRAGARVIGTVSTEEKELRARSAGADEVIRYTEQDVVTEVERLTQGRGVQVVYDGVGKDTFYADLDSLALHGYLILFGQASGPVGPVDPQILNTKGSLYLQRPSLFHYMGTTEELQRRAGEVLRWVASGELEIRISSVFPLAEVAEAHRALEGRKTSGKVLLQS